MAKPKFPFFYDVPAESKPNGARNKRRKVI